jgi:hypothetical protein|tara:strand:- start:395 stop:655 length:261 start_codon:yes stop_codon:yes gene_type:complete
MHEERTNNTDTHPKYDNFKMHQKIVSNLEKDDVVKLLVNDEVKFECKVLYGNSAHVNISLQDKGERLEDLTQAQIQEAIALYRQQQ